MNHWVYGSIVHHVVSVCLLRFLVEPALGNGDRQNIDQRSSVFILVGGCTDVYYGYYLDWAHIIFHQYYCLRVNRIQSAILKMVEIRILQRHLSL